MCISATARQTRIHLLQNCHQMRLWIRSMSVFEMQNACFWCKKHVCFWYNAPSAHTSAPKIQSVLSLDTLGEVQARSARNAANRVFWGARHVPYVSYLALFLVHRGDVGAQGARRTNFRAFPPSHALLTSTPKQTIAS